MLLAQIAPNKISSSDLEAAFRERDHLKRAEMILEWAGRLNCRKFVTANDIVEVKTKTKPPFLDDMMMIRCVSLGLMNENENRETQS